SFTRREPDLAYLLFAPIANFAHTGSGEYTLECTCMGEICYWHWVGLGSKDILKNENASEEGGRRPENMPTCTSK
ncbi:MAG: hypothetical protein V1880_02355, partial [Patescibacteria group bacterium]